MSRPIPEGWQEDIFASIAQLIKGASYTSENYSDNGAGMPFITLKSFQKGGGYNHRGLKRWIGDTSNLPIAESGDLLIANTDVTREGDVVGAPILLPNLDQESAIFSMDVSQVRVTADVSKPFLFYLLQTRDIRAKVKSLASGSTVLHLDLAGVIRIPLLLPPLPEQQKIAEILGSVDAAIEATRAVITQTRRTQKVLMEELLTKGLPGRHTKFKKTPWGTAPEDWEIKTIVDLFEIQLGKMLSQKAKEGINPKPYLANYNVRWNGIDISKIQYMDFSEREMTKFRLRKGDLLVCEGGEIGRCAIWEEPVFECYYQKALHRLRPRSNQILPQFIVFFMQNASSNGYFSDYSGVNTIAHLTAEKLTLLKVPLPPIEEQEAISLLITQVDDSTKKHNEYLNGLENLKSALMQVLLIGEKRVCLKQTEGVAV